MYPIGFREAAMRAYAQLNSLRKVSELLNVSISSLSRWCRRLHSKNWKKSPRVLTETVVDLIHLALQDDTSRFSCSSILEFLEKHHQVRISRQLVHLVVRKRLNYTFKRSRKRGKCDVLTQRSSVHNFLKRLDRFRLSGKLVAVDECGFDQRCVPVYAYAPKGNPAILAYLPNTKDRSRVTMVMGIDSATGSHFKHLLQHPCNSRAFAVFLNDMNFPEGTGIILDNASIHKTKDVQEVAKQKGYELLFTPPYTPEANPIEMVFGVVKNRFYRLRYDSSFQSTTDAVERSVASTLTPSGVTNTFRSSRRQVKEIAGGMRRRSMDEG